MGGVRGGASRGLALFTFDNLGEAAEVGAGTLRGARPPGEDASLAVGLPRILDLLDAQRVRASFFVEGWNGENHPDAVREIVRRGHELGMHGWAHETWHRLDAEAEAELARRATDALESAAGVRPRGFRAPGGSRTPTTHETLAALGYTYDASLGDGMRPTLLPSGLAQVPFVWPGVDGFFALRDAPVPAGAVRQRWLGALEKAASRGGLFVLVCHPHITGLDPARLEVLATVMATAARHPDLEVCTAGDAARALRGASPQASRS